MRRSARGMTRTEYEINVKQSFHVDFATLLIDG